MTTATTTVTNNDPSVTLTMGSPTWIESVAPGATSSPRVLDKNASGSGYHVNAPSKISITVKNVQGPDKAAVTGLSNAQLAEGESLTMDIDPNDPAKVRWAAA